jgi:undecaprenyl diphosphate synthase
MEDQQQVAALNRALLPQHVAIIMDGNGRWAKQRNLPRMEGHRQGLESVRAIINHCLSRKIPVLTLFAFGTDNWLRPQQEVSFLMDIFLMMLQKEIDKLHKNGVSLRIIGDLSRFSEPLQAAIHNAQDLTKNNQALVLNIAANYGGRWDIIQAAQKIMRDVQAGRLQCSDLTEDVFNAHMSLAGLPPPDLFIRTSGEQRISNFLLWDLKYTELYFTEVYWPDFREAAFEAALSDYQSRQRRFGMTGEQVATAPTQVAEC